MTKTLLFLLILLAASATDFVAQNSDRPLVTVSGQAEVLVAPDEVFFNIRASTLDKDIVIAQSRNDEIVKRVIGLARTYSIPPELIKTDHISVDEEYSSEEATRKPSVFVGYRVVKKVGMVLRDVSKAERFLSDLFKTGMTGIESVDFRSSQMRKYRDQARALAIKAAQEKANAFAREIGQTIGKAFTITEEGIGGSYASNTANFSRGVSGSYNDSDSTLSLGQISISARVVVSFELK